MSIVALKKITIFGPFSEKISILDNLQAMGCLHIIPLKVQQEILNKSDSFTVPQEALAHLYNCSIQLNQIEEDQHFDPASIEKEILQNKRAIESLQDEKEVIEGQIRELAPWGDFVLPNPNELGGLTLWFYAIPHRQVEAIRNSYFQIVNKDNVHSYITVVSKEEPEGMPTRHLKIPRTPLKELHKRLYQLKFQLEDLQTERIRLTRWRDLFEKNLFRLEDNNQLQKVSSTTYDSEPIFAIQAWIPSQEMQRMKNYAKEKKLILKEETPGLNETPPTLLKNNPKLSGGQDLLSFYMTPNYWLWDPSLAVFFSFAVFFAMIFSDAGYGLVLMAITGLYWKKMGVSPIGKRFRIVMLILGLFSIIWGVLVGSYFGIEPSKTSILANFKIFDMNNYEGMMGLAIMIGALHISLANIAQAWSKRSSAIAISHLGWALVPIGAIIYFLIPKQFEVPQMVKTTGVLLMGLGFTAVILFTSDSRHIWKRIGIGLFGLTRITGMFGDVLSYLRLYALGLASASLAITFNDLAKKTYLALPGFKIIFFLLIVLIGHGMNFALSMMSGFIHGLRLNYIEFFNWGLPEEGSTFNVFSKKERSKWKQ